MNSGMDRKESTSQTVLRQNRAFCLSESVTSASSPPSPIARKRQRQHKLE